MDEINQLSLVWREAGWLARSLANQTFQRLYATCFSILGMVLAIGVIFAMIYTPSLPLAEPFAWSTFAIAMKSSAKIMVLMLALTASLLGLYISWRGTRRPLARYLASMCGSIALFAGMLCFPYIFKKEYTSHRLREFIESSDMWLSWLLQPAFILIQCLACAVLMFSMFVFFAHFPKPVKFPPNDSWWAKKLLDTDAELAKKPLERLWRCIASPVFFAPAAGMVALLLVWFQAGGTAFYGFSLVSWYMIWCWLPFAWVSAKYKDVGDEDRQAIRWVVVGLSLWLALFLFLYILVFVARATGLLEFPDPAQSWYFTEDLLIFSFAGFMTVLLLALAFATFYRGTLDPDLVIRRTWVVALVSIISGMLFVVVERYIAVLLTRWFDVSAGTAFTLVGIFTAVCVFLIRTWAERFVKRLVERWQSTYLLADGVREEAVIVFADPSGYTALTEKNEREALILAAVFHRDAERVAAAHRGRLIKTIGDAVMLRFPKVDDAYAATKRLIEDYTNHARPLVSAPLPIHAALHRGEVVEGSNGDVFGATVNLAARLLGAAGPHEVVASEAAVETLSEKSQAESMGSRAFKNVENLVTCFRLATA